MADTNTDRLGLLQMEEGSHANEWGDLTNLNLGRLDASTRGFKEIEITAPETLDATDITVTTTPAEDEAFFHYIEFTGTPSATTIVTVQAEEMVWCVLNNTDSIITLTPSGGTGTNLAVGKYYVLAYIAADTAFTNLGAVPGDVDALTVTNALTAGTIDGVIGSVTPAVVTGTTLEATGDTSAGDNSAIGYTAAEGAIVTGQGSTNDVTIKNDADEDVLAVPTGTQEAAFQATYSETAASYSVTTGTKDLDIANATYFYPSGAMTAVAVDFTFSNPVATGRVSSFTLELNNMDANTDSTPWPTSVDWSGGTEPVWTSGVDIVSFVTRDGGTTWIGFLGGLAFA